MNQTSIAFADGYNVRRCVDAADAVRRFDRFRSVRRRTGRPLLTTTAEGLCILGIFSVRHLSSRIRSTTISTGRRRSMTRRRRYCCFFAMTYWNYQTYVVQMRPQRRNRFELQREERNISPFRTAFNRKICLIARFT